MEDTQYEKPKENIIELDEDLESKKENKIKDNKQSSNKETTQNNINRNKKYKIFCKKIEYFIYFKDAILETFFDGKKAVKMPN